MTKRGHVSLVGAGPGDPELFSGKALGRLRAAEVVVYDALVIEALLAECRAVPSSRRRGSSPPAAWWSALGCPRASRAATERWQDTGRTR